jgi:hypothetical protein
MKLVEAAGIEPGSGMKKTRSSRGYDVAKWLGYKRAASIPEVARADERLHSVAFCRLASGRLHELGEIPR